VKLFLLTTLALLGCSTNKQDKEFRRFSKEETPSTTTVQVDAPQPLLDKFEVKELAAPKKKKIALTTEDPKKKSLKKDPPPPAPVQDAPSLKQLPADYPVGLVNLNAQAEKVWKTYRTNHYPGQKTVLDVNFLGMVVGKIMVVNNGKKMVNGKEVWHFHSRFKSAPFYSKIYELDDMVDTYVTTDQFLSTRFSLIQRETKQNVDDLQLHDRELMKTFWFYKQKKSDGDIRHKEKEGYIPFYSIDPFSVLYFFQGLPLKNGDTYEIPVINKSKILILKSEVKGREVIETQLGKKRAIRVQASTRYSGQTLKSGELEFWFSDDQYRVFLRGQAKIKIGSVTAEIIKN
jgi:hypothetical protein